MRRNKFYDFKKKAPKIVVFSKYGLSRIIDYIRWEQKFYNGNNRVGKDYNIKIILEFEAFNVDEYGEEEMLGSYVLKACDEMPDIGEAKYVRITDLRFVDRDDETNSMTAIGVIAQMRSLYEPRRDKYFDEYDASLLEELIIDLRPHIGSRFLIKW